MSKQFILLGLLLCSCGGALKNYSELKGLRILAIQASAPETTVGSTVNLSPVVSFYDNSGAGVTWEAFGCTNPGLTAGATSCDSASDKLSLGSGSLTFTTSANTDLFASLFSATIPATFLDNVSGPLKIVGIDYVISFKVTASNGDVQRAFKRIHVSTNPSPNNNPTLNGVLVDGNSMSVYPKGSAHFKPDIASGSKETYTYYDGSSKQEDMLTTWFSTSGSFKVSRTLESNEVEFAPDAGRDQNKKSAIVAVLRDERDGVSIKVYNDL